MRLIPSFAFASFVLTAAGCAPVTLPPPPAPEKSEPVIPTLPESPPAPQHGRLIVDANGAPASVSRITETTTVTFGARHGREAARKEELLCMAPCAIDLRHGAHALVFRSTSDPTRSSVAEVVVSSKSTILRHAMGRELKFEPGYVGGAALTLAGTGFSLMGALTTGLAFVAKEPEPGQTDQVRPKTLLPIGLVLLGIGVAATTAGILVMHNHRPVQQGGSTTQWTKDPPPPPLPPAAEPPAADL